ncbi:MAG: hypothetical protein IT535_10175 [Bauldia sp.]|nr:hypothetical protein [Bauldia sp.]
MKEGSSCALPFGATAPAFPFGMLLCRDAEGLFAAKAETGWTTRLLGISDGGRPTYLSMAADGRFELIAEPLPGLACLILSGVREEGPPAAPEPLDQREG